jgi:hypothetical protein
MRAGLPALLLLAGCTCSSGSSSPAGPRTAQPEAEEAPEFADVAGGIAWHADEPLLARRPSSPMRAAEYAVRGHEAAELGVFHFPQEEGGGGGVDENLERWIGQFAQPDGRPSRDAARIEHRDVSGVRVTTVDVSGTFTPMPMGPGSPSGPREGWRMLAAIAEAPRGMVFFKLTGPEAAVSDAEGAFDALLQSIRPAD